MIEKKNFGGLSCHILNLIIQKVLDKLLPHMRRMEYMQAQAAAADELIRKELVLVTGLDLPENYDREEFDRILKAAEQIKSDSDVLDLWLVSVDLVVPSSIGFLNHYFASFANKRRTKRHKSHAGNKSHHLADLVEYADKDFSVNVISKSGTTTEPAIVLSVSSKELFS